MILPHSVRCPSKNPEHFRHLAFYPDPSGEPAGKSNTKSGAEAKCLRSPSDWGGEHWTYCLVIYLQQQARSCQYKKRGPIPQRQRYQLPAMLSNSWSKRLSGCHSICQASPPVIYLMPKEFFNLQL